MAGMTSTEVEQARAIASATMTAVVEFRTPGPAGGWDPVDGATPGVPVVLWTGPARVQAVSSRTFGVMDVAGQVITNRPYKISTPHDSPLLPRDGWVLVTEHPTDPTVVGAQLRAGTGVVGDLGIERTTYCTLDLSNQEAMT